MIERYCTKEMSKIWSEENKFKKWILVEKTVNDNLQKYNIIPQNGLSNRLDKINIEKLIKRSKEIEREIKHDLNAFVFACEEFCGKKDGRWIHFGLTSSDILDTTNALLVKESSCLLWDKLDKIERIFFEFEEQTRNILHVCRTHGQKAQISYLSRFFKLYANSFGEYQLNSLYLKIPAKISGAVGDNSHIPEIVELECLKFLHLEVDKDATQVVQRDYYAELIFKLAMIACLVEKFALQIRLYQQSGIEEMSEGFSRGQTGSSAMPHKQNPISCENLCGLARIVRSYVAPSMETISLWQERDLTNSSVERIILPDIFNLVDFMLHRTIEVVDNLHINYEKIEEHVNNFKDNNSQERMLYLIRKGKGRREAHEWVKKTTGANK